MGISVAYHWLDGRDNPIVWDGLRTLAPQLEPGAAEVVELRVRAPIPPGGYRLAFDMVAENRAWFSELGSDRSSVTSSSASAAASRSTRSPTGSSRRPTAPSASRAAHAEGYGVVGGRVAWEGFHRPRALASYEPGPGRMPGFAAPLLCPSVLAGVELERSTTWPACRRSAPRATSRGSTTGGSSLTARPRSGRRPT